MINAELVLAAPGGDLVMGFGVHIRIDPQRDDGGLAHFGRDPRQGLKFGVGR